MISVVQRTAKIMRPKRSKDLYDLHERIMPAVRVNGLNPSDWLLIVLL